MPTLQVVCPHCAKGSSIDTDLLPDTPVALACPACIGQITLDKNELLANRPAAGGTVPAGEGAATSTAGAEAGGGQTPDSLLPPGFEIPEGAKLPSGVLIGDDVVAMGTLTQTLEPYGCQLRPLASAADVLKLVDIPPLLFYVAGAVDAYPYAPLEPLVTLPSRARRRTFLVLVADNLETLNGNDSFLYQVNLILNKAHLSAAAELLYLGLAFHERLYGPLLAISQI